MAERFGFYAITFTAALAGLVLLVLGRGEFWRSAAAGLIVGNGLVLALAGSLRRRRAWFDRASNILFATAFALLVVGALFRAGDLIAFAGGVGVASRLGLLFPPPHPGVRRASA